MGTRDFEKILNGLPKIGIFVIREDNRELLYFNRRVKELAPQAQVGAPSSALLSGLCGDCPAIAAGQEYRSVGYSDAFGGVIDIVVSKLLWEETTPAFLITVLPRVDTIGITYRKILRVDLLRDCCDVIKSEPGGFLAQGGGACFSQQLERFIHSGAIHPGDVERFAAFTRLEALRGALASGKEALTCVYRRRASGGWRWNLMEMVPGFDHTPEAPVAVLSVKDVDGVLREGLELEETVVRRREVIRMLGEENFSVYTLNLDSGEAMSIQGDYAAPGGLVPRLLSWEGLMVPAIKKRLHPIYHMAFEEKFSLEALRRARSAGERKAELLGQWRSGETYRYISITAHLQGSGGLTVLAFQDVDERMHRELAYSQRDMQMAAILKSRFSMMSTVQLDSGQCERISLSGTPDLQHTLVGDYDYYIQQALIRFIHPEDVDACRDILSLKHLREKAAGVEDYLEEVCQYRTREDPPRWLEQRVIYTRHGDEVMVNILGQDITREKSQRDEQMQAIQDRTDIITSLNKLFFSTYYVDLEHETFRPVTQLSRVGDLLGGEVNCTAAMQIYAKNFIHPDDRAEYLRIMSIPHWREHLRWWSPSVEVEYRKMPEGPDPDSEPYQWVRATAALARVGADDLPRTLVYVAQDITSHRTA